MLLLDIVDVEIVVDECRPSIEELATEQQQFIFRWMFGERSVRSKLHCNGTGRIGRGLSYLLDGGSSVGSSITTFSTALFLSICLEISCSIFS